MFDEHIFIYCEPPKGTLSEAKSSRRGRAYRSREDLYSDKIAIEEKKVCSLFRRNRKRSTDMYLMKIRFLSLINLIFFGRNLLYN